MPNVVEYLTNLFVYPEFRYDSFFDNLEDRLRFPARSIPMELYPEDMHDAMRKLASDSTVFAESAIRGKTFRVPVLYPDGRIVRGDMNGKVIYPTDCKRAFWEVPCSRLALTAGITVGLPGRMRAFMAVPAVCIIADHARHVVKSREAGDSLAVVGAISKINIATSGGLFADW
jgi:hypothetical protein